SSCTQSRSICSCKAFPPFLLHHFRPQTMRNLLSFPPFLLHHFRPQTMRNLLYLHARTGSGCAQ
ncbi:hypothetical protein GOODEAATRI_011547, partial [Goodea atripinnis]